MLLCGLRPLTPCTRVFLRMYTLWAERSHLWRLHARYNSDITALDPVPVARDWTVIASAIMPRVLSGYRGLCESIEYLLMEFNDLHAAQKGYLSYDFKNLLNSIFVAYFNLTIQVFQYAAFRASQIKFLLRTGNCAASASSLCIKQTRCVSAVQATLPRSSSSSYNPCKCSLTLKLFISSKLAGSAVPSYTIKSLESNRA